MMTQKIVTVFFDLDGTLADTSTDLTHSLNELFVEEGKKTVEKKSIIPVISKGSTAMLKLGLDFDENSNEHLHLKQRLFDIYHKRNHKETRLFSGMEDVLLTLENNQIKWGIVTNKLTHLTKPLIKKLKLEKGSQCLICGDTTDHPKPHPAPLLLAAKLTKSKPENCVYVGDAQNDIIAAKSANMSAVIARYGFIPDDENPDVWGADGDIESPEELLHWLEIS